MTAKTCPDCHGPIKVRRGERDGMGHIIGKAVVRVTHRPTCPQWQQRVRQHGGHPDITELVHEGEQVKISEAGW